MENYFSIDEFKLKGKDCFCVENNFACRDFNHLIGKDVMINNKVERVIGVERFAHGKTYVKGERIVLMVN